MQNGDKNDTDAQFIFWPIEEPAAAAGKQPHKWGWPHRQSWQQSRPGPAPEESEGCPAHHYLRWPDHDLRLPGRSQRHFLPDSNKS